MPEGCTVGEARRQLEHQKQLPMVRTKLLFQGKILTDEAPIVVIPNQPIVLFLSKPPNPAQTVDICAFIRTQLTSSTQPATDRLNLLRAAWAQAASPGEAACRELAALTLQQITQLPLHEQPASQELLCCTACQLAKWLRGSSRPASPEQLLQCAGTIGQDDLRGALLIRVARLLFCGEDGRLSAGWNMMQSLQADLSPLKVLIQTMSSSELPLWHAELARILHDVPAAWPTPAQTTTGQSSVDSASAATAAAALQLLAAVPEGEEWVEHRTRLIAVVGRSWLGLGQQVQDVACPVILRWVFDCTTNSPAAPSSALCSLLATIPQEYVQVVTMYIADDGSMLSDSSLGRCLCRMLTWPLDSPVKASWVAAVLRGVVSKGRLVLLTQAATTESAALFARLEKQELASHTVGLLETLLGGCQFTPDAFHACLVHVPSVLASFQSQGGDGSAVFKRVLFLLQCMMFAHPGHPELYQSPMQYRAAVCCYRLI